MTQAQFLYEGMTGAPAGVTNGQGSVIAILDACLVNGFNSHTVTTSATESGSTVTVVDTAHGFKDAQLVAISGASPSGYNGTFRVTVVDANTFTYTAASGLGAASGTITAQTPSLGWSKAFAGSNQACYRAPTGNQFYLNIDDSGATGSWTTCRVRGYESMSGVMAGTNPFPTDASLSGAGPYQHWLRPAQAGNGGSNYGWVVIGDAKRFFIGIPGYSTGHWRGWHGFGDFTSYVAGDAFNTFMAGEVSGGNGDTYNYSQAFPSVVYNPGAVTASSFYPSSICVARSYDQATKGANAGLWNAFAIQSGAQMTGSSYSYCTSSAVGTPNPITSGYDLSVNDLLDHDVTASGQHAWRRGRLPGMLAYLGAPDFENNDTTVYHSIPQFGSVIAFGGGNSSNTGGVVFALNDWDSM